MPHPNFLAFIVSEISAFIRLTLIVSEISAFILVLIVSEISAFIRNLYSFRDLSVHTDRQADRRTWLDRLVQKDGQTDMARSPRS